MKHISNYLQSLLSLGLLVLTVSVMFEPGEELYKVILLELAYIALI